MSGSSPSQPFRHKRMLISMCLVGAALGPLLAAREGETLIALPVTALNLVAIGMITGHVTRFFNLWPHNRVLGDWFEKAWVYFLLFFDAVLLLALILSRPLFH